MSRNVVSCTQPAGQGNDSELIPMIQMESQHSVGWPIYHDFRRFVTISEILRPESEVVENSRPKVAFLEKKSPYGQIFIDVFHKDSWRHRSTSCVQISWKLTKSCVIYLTKKNKISARSPALAAARITPKICRGQLQTIYSESPKFHPNLYTSCGVIAGRVNIVETCHKVSNTSKKLKPSLVASYMTSGLETEMPILISVLYKIVTHPHSYTPRTHTGCWGLNYFYVNYFYMYSTQWQF